MAMHNEEKQGSSDRGFDPSRANQPLCKSAEQRDH
jgi:hypothetical protein